MKKTFTFIAYQNVKAHLQNSTSPEFHSVEEDIYIYTLGVIRKSTSPEFHSVRLATCFGFIQLSLESPVFVRKTLGSVKLAIMQQKISDVIGR